MGNFLASFAQPISNTYRAIVTITSNGLIEKDSIVSFKAGQSISLVSGFHAEKGSELTVQIENCQVNPNPPTSNGISIDKKHSIQENVNLLSSLEKNIKVYPNPSGNFFTVELDIFQYSNLPIFSLFDVTGKQIHTIVLKDNSERLPF